MPKTESPKPQTAWACDLCGIKIIGAENVFTFEGALSKKGVMDYELCWRCSAKLRKEFLKLVKKSG